MSSASTLHTIRTTGRVPFHLIVLLALTSAIGPLSTDMYLPAFPVLDQDLGGGPGSAQFTLATWFAGLAAGQFSCGPLSDRLGRRTPLLIGMMVFTLASAGCALTTDYRAFCLFRFIAAFGGSAGSVIPRAVIRDIATGRQGAKIMTQLTLIFGVMPILAPSVGSLILTEGSWRWIFGLTVIYGALATVALWFQLPDTLPPQRRLHLPPAAILHRYGMLLREPHFMLNALIASAGTFVMFAYLGGSPVVFEHLIGFTPQQYGLFFGLNAALFIAATQITGVLIHHYRLESVMQAGIFACAAMAALFVLLTATGIATPATPLLVAGLVMGVTFALGFIGANATVLAFHHHGAQAGSASALLGTIQFSLGALSGTLMGFMPASSIVPMASVMALGPAMMIVLNALRRRWCAEIPSQD